ncbi:hypothetical protein Poly59_36590 [Rubripirellula reticaptiva]|uniref:Uncharacterized protein n=1 Tax=Rubripirellula reticaptiva TaxID=2528013 RepID=A0A5C6EN93_9BACT|nr:hypothetical protein Poly59_36590 [Rubripirellula reticaptiva]
MIHSRECSTYQLTANALRALSFEGEGHDHGTKILSLCGKQPRSDVISKGMVIGKVAPRWLELVRQFQSGAEK